MYFVEWAIVPPRLFCSTMVAVFYVSCEGIMSEFQTRVTQRLDALGIPYRLLSHSRPVYTVVEAAQERGVAVEIMVKSMLLRDKDNHFVMACILGHAAVYPQAVRAQMPDTWRRLSFATPDEIEAITGYVPGAVSPVVLPEMMPLLFDVAITHCDLVNISSGDPMAGIELSADDLIEITGAKIAAITRERT